MAKKETVGKMLQKKRQRRGLLVAQLQSWIARLAAWFASGTVRVTLLFIAVIITLYLGITRVWAPLSQESPLPPGIDVRDPSLDTSLLQSIGALRVKRITPREKTFNVDSRFNVPSATPE